MSKIQKEIHDNAAEVVKTVSCTGQLQRLSDDVLNQIAGGWVNVYARWLKKF